MAKKVVTVFPKGTVVKFNNIPCELLQDTPYYSETFQQLAKKVNRKPFSWLWKKGK